MAERPSHYHTSGVRDLTPRQQEVLRLLARGYTNGQVAQELGITLDGAKFHVSEILSRLEVSTREEAAEAWRARRGPGRRLLAFGAPLLAGRAVVTMVAGTLAIAVGVAIVSLVMNPGDGAPRAGSRAGAVTAIALFTVTPGPVLESRATAFGVEGATPAPVSDEDRVRLVNPTTGETGSLAVGRGDFAWSPDGRYLAVSNDLGVYLAEVATGTVVRILSGTWTPIAWSPDGRLGMADPGTALDPQAVHIYDPGDGAYTALGPIPAGFAPDGGATASLSWSPDGETLALTSSDGPLVLIASDGTVRASDGTERVRTLRWLPDGTFVIVSSVDNVSPASAAHVELRDGSPRELARIELAATWPFAAVSADGRFIFQTLDPVRELSTIGVVATPFLTAGGVPRWGGAAMNTAADAASLVRPVGAAIALLPSVCDPAGAISFVSPDDPTGVGFAAPGAFVLSWSPDGSRAAFTARGGLFVVNADGTGLRQVSPSGHSGIAPAWSPNGESIAYDPTDDASNLSCGG